MGDVIEFERRKRGTAPSAEAAYALAWLGQQLDPADAAGALIDDIVDELLAGGVSSSPDDLKRALAGTRAELTEALGLLVRKSDVAVILRDRGVA